MTRAQRRRLPKAGLISVEWAQPIFPGRRWLQANRLANAMRLRIGNLVLVWRMPWLERSARALHPELFDVHAATRPASA